MKITAGGESRPTGEARLTLIRDLGVLRPPPRGWSISNWLRHRRRDVPRNVTMRLVGRVLGVARLESQLQGVVYRRVPNLAPWQMRGLSDLLASNHDLLDLPRFFGGELINYGVLSTRVVTDAGVNYIVDGFQNITEIENFKFHGYGTGTNAEAAGNTTLQTELTTQYAGDVRPTGSQTEGAANVYRTVGTLSPDSGGTIAITEHGIFTANSAGTLLDRSVFSAINLVAGSDSLQTTYDLTVASGG